VTEVAFHFGAPDRLAYTCRLLRKATATGARLLVRTTPDACAELDAALWSLGPTEFISHCTALAPAAVRSRSAVLLIDDAAALDTAFPVLVNLAEEVPEGFEQFQRVIEVVSTDEQDRNLARRRWKHYTERGYSITRHDLKSRAGE
jgi:DNA polymerase-3 subunit chi